jgi:peroxiredoxin
VLHWEAMRFTRLVGALTAVVLVAGVVAVVGHDDGGTRVNPFADPERPPMQVHAPTIAIERMDGSGTFRLADYKGTPVVVNFFSATCGPCIREMPGLEGLHQRLGDDVHFIGIAERDSDALNNDLVEQTGVTYEIARDPRGDVFAAFRALYLPETYIIGADGTISDVYREELRASYLRKELRVFTGV